MRPSIGIAVAGLVVACQAPITSRDVQRVGEAIIERGSNGVPHLLVSDDEPIYYLRDR